MLHTALNRNSDFHILKQQIKPDLHYWLLRKEPDFQALISLPLQFSNSC